MRPIPLTPEILEIARRVVWFEPPEQALADPIRFMAYAMSYARHEDMKVIRRYVSDEELKEALEHAPPGIIDARSWAYWNNKMGRYPAPPMPARRAMLAAGARERNADEAPRKPALDECGARTAILPRV